MAGIKSQQKQIAVALSENHLQRVAQCDPTTALTELVWNALDAGADQVDVSIVETEAEGVSEVRVEDNGIGISPDVIDSAFGNLGDSIKIVNQTNTRGHRVHGRLGEGRFKAYSLGNQVEWRTKTKDGFLSVIKGRVEVIKKFEVVTEKDNSDKRPGTLFVAYNGYGAEMLLPKAEVLANRLTVTFAMKLLAERDIKITVNGRQLNPLSRIKTQQEPVALEGFEDTKVKTVIWLTGNAQELVWGDVEFNGRQQEPVEFMAGVSCSVFIGSAEVSKAITSNTFAIRESTSLGQIKEKALEVAHDFISKTAREEIARTVQGLKRSGVYPFEGDPKAGIDLLERNVFDVCATKVIESIPSLASGPKDRQMLTLHLLRTAIESSPTSVQHVFEKILKLPKDQIDELAEVLKRVSLTGLIKLGRLVSDRRDFLHGLEQILFKREFKKHLLERLELHKILERETWIFGEEFSLGSSDESLNDVLASHRSLLKHGEDEVEIEYGGKKEMRKIPDLVLARQYKFGAADHYHHLVVELKRPSIKVGFEEKSQIENYAATVYDNPLFDKTKTRWTFVVVSNEVSDKVANLIGPTDGRVDNGSTPNIMIYAKPWASILQAAKGRMDYLWERAELQSSRGDGMDYLKQKFPSIMAGLAERVAAAEA